MAVIVGFIAAGLFIRAVWPCTIWPEPPVGVSSTTFVFFGEVMGFEAARSTNDSSSIACIRIHAVEGLFGAQDGQDYRVTLGQTQVDCSTRFVDREHLENRYPVGIKVWVIAELAGQETPEGESSLLEASSAKGGYIQGIIDEFRPETSARLDYLRYGEARRKARLESIRSSPTNPGPSDNFISDLVLFQYYDAYREIFRAVSANTESERCEIIKHLAGNPAYEASPSAFAGVVKEIVHDETCKQALLASLSDQ